MSPGEFIGLAVLLVTIGAVFLGLFFNTLSWWLNQEFDIPPDDGDAF